MDVRTTPFHQEKEQHVENLVVGGGIMGQSAARALADRGREVTVIDKAQTLPTDAGSSHGGSRAIFAPTTGPEPRALFDATMQEWRELEISLRTNLLRSGSGIEVAPAESEQFSRVKAALSALGVTEAELSADGVSTMFPQIKIRAEERAILRNDVSFVNPEAVLEALLAVPNVNRITGTEVTSISPGEKIRVETSAGAFVADRLILTTGAWICELLTQLGENLPLTITSEQFAFFRVSEPDQFGPDKFPLISHLRKVTDRVPGFKVAPALGPEGIKVMERSGGPIVNITEDLRVSDERLARVTDYARETVSGIELTPHSAKVCRYAFTPDWQFVINNLPEQPNVFVGAGCSGGQFKFGPLFGRLLVQLALDGKTDFPLDYFSVRRFQ